MSLIMAMTILFHFAPTIGGMAWSIHQHGFHVNYAVDASRLRRTRSPSRMGNDDHAQAKDRQSPQGMEESCGS